MADKASSIKVSKVEFVLRFVEQGFGIDWMGDVERQTRKETLRRW